MNASEVSTMSLFALVNFKWNSVKDHHGRNRLQHPMHLDFVLSTSDRHRESIFVVKRKHSFAHEELVADCSEPGVIGHILLEADMESQPSDVKCRDAYQCVIEGVAEYL